MGGLALDAAEADEVEDTLDAELPRVSGVSDSFPDSKALLLKNLFHYPEDADFVETTSEGLYSFWERGKATLQVEIHYHDMAHDDEDTEHP